MAGFERGIRARGAADGGLIDLDDFVDVLGADNFAVRGGRFGGAIEFLRERAIENVVDESGFSGAGDAGDDGEQAERQGDVNFFEIVGARAEDLNDFSVGAAAFFGDRDLRRTAEILASKRFSGGFDLRWFALGNEVAAGVAGSGAEVDNEIGAANGVFVVFDDEDGIAKIAKLFERTEKASVVAGMEANAGLIENIENAAEARANLRGEADALGFAAGERGGGAVEAEITKAHGEKEIDAFGNFFKRASGDFFLALGKLRENFVNGGARGAKRERGEIRDGQATEFDGERFGAQTLAMADGALRGRHILRDPLTVGVGVGLFEISLEEF